MLTGRLSTSCALLKLIVSQLVFLGALDQTIVAVSMPKIVEDIGGESSYSWVGSAYLLSTFF